MIESPEVWEDLFGRSGFTDVLNRKAGEAVKQIRDGMPRAAELLADGAWEDVRDSLFLRFREIWLGVMPKALAGYMGTGEYVEKVFFCDRVTPALLEAVSRFSGYVLDGGWDRIAGDYPMAVRYGTIVQSNFTASYLEFLERYGQCRPEISRRFFGGRDTGRILSFPKRETVLKQHGRTVLCVRSEGGTFYYKPRDCSVDAFFHDLTAKHFADVTCAPDVIEGDGFGFCTELVRKPVEKAEDIGRYFYNFGALTALYLGLNGGDLHAKNILACGIYPASIDLEDLFTPEIRTPGTRFMTAGEKAGKRSLAMMAVLPSRDFLTDSFTSSLHPCGDSGFANLPVYGGKTYDVTGHEEEYLRGFRDGYGRTLALRDEIISGLEQRRGMTVRSLYNSPTVQNMLMDRVLMPDFLASEEKTEQELDRLRISYGATGKTLVPEILEYEKRCIRERDLPYYCADLFSADLYGNDTDELIMKSAFTESPFDSVKKKLYSLGEAEMQMEEKLIRTGLEYAPLDDARTDSPAPHSAVFLTRALIRSEISGILDKTAHAMIPAPDGSVFWRSGAVRYYSRKELPFYVLQADVLRLCGNVMIRDGGQNAEKAEALAERCLDGIAGKIRLWQEDRDFPFAPGAVYGIGALLNGLALAERAGSGRSRELLDRLVEMLSIHSPAGDTDLTFANGLCGLLAALCGLPVRKTDAAEAGRLVLIARTADRIAEHLREGPGWNRLRDAGDPFDGPAGAGAALVLADKAAGTVRYAGPVQRIFSGICDRFSEDICGWFFSDKKRLFLRADIAAGIGMCAAQAYESFGEPPESVRKCLELALRSILAEAGERILYGQDTLRNGNALRAAFLDRCERILPDRGCREKAREILAAMIGRKQAAGDYIIFPPGVRNAPDPSFMLGTAGIGAVLAAFG